MRVKLILLISNKASHSRREFHLAGRKFESFTIPQGWTFDLLAKFEIDSNMNLILNFVINNLGLPENAQSIPGKVSTG